MAPANNHLGCQCLLFLTSPACTSFQCLLYTDRWPAHSVQPVLSIVQRQRDPLLVYLSGSALLHMRQYSKVKRKGTFHQRCSRNHKPSVSYFNSGLAWKSLHRHCSLDRSSCGLPLSTSAFCNASSEASSSWRSTGSNFCFLYLAASCCTLLHLASTTAFWSSHFGPSSQTA